jgi:hypothetical protein
MITSGGKVLRVIRVVLIGSLIGVLPTVGYMQVDSTLLRRVSCFSLGVVAGMHGSDAGMGVEATSSPFLRKSLSVRVRGGLNWLESYKSLTGENMTYPSLAAAIVYQTPVANRIRFYIETGFFVLLPSDEFSNRSSVPGFSSSAGVELFARYKRELMISYFFGGGLAVCDAKAEKLESQPDYGDGFLFTNGLRFYF